MTTGTDNASQSELITTRREGHVLWIGFNRPKERNAFNTEMLIALSNAYTTLDRDPELRCGIVYAEGKQFTLGLDLPDVSATMRREGRVPLPDGNLDPWGIRGPVRTTPIIVASHGMCITLGIELMLAADIRLCAPRSAFGQIEVQRGLLPFGGATTRFPALSGWGNAMRYILTGDTFDENEALRIGLVQEIVDKAELRNRAFELATRVAEQAPLGVQASIEMARVAEREGAGAAAEKLQPKALELMETEDAHEGVQSFIEKRKPVYRGK
ncbi:MAG: crotonase/enoyl-CoA hydratase family protein [bacterium]|nr:crotonase/enoyl-CoA hydratase family protein [bacterium]